MLYLSRFNEERCPHCGMPLRETAILTEQGLVCRSCGFVIESSPFDLGPEWRSFTEDDRQRRSRVGAPLSSRVHTNGVTTYIRVSRRGDPGQQRLAAIQARMITHGNQRLIQLLQETNRVAGRLRLPPHVAETMARLVRKLHAMKLIKRNNMMEFIAAAAVIAARIERHPLSMKHVSNELDVDQHALWRAYRTIVKKLRVRTAAVPRPSMYVSRIASKLGLGSDVEALAYRFTDLLVRTGIAQGKPPEALAAAAVYVSSILLDKKRNQIDIAGVVGVSDATIRNRYRDIVDNYYIEVRL